MKFATPFIFKGAVAAVHLALVTFAALWTGVPKASDRLADDWTYKAYQAGVPIGYLNLAYWITRILAVLVIFAGWVIMAVATVVLLVWIF